MFIVCVNPVAGTISLKEGGIKFTGNWFGKWSTSDILPRARDGRAASRVTAGRSLLIIENKKNGGQSQYHSVKCPLHKPASAGDIALIIYLAVTYYFYFYPRIHASCANRR